MKFIVNSQLFVKQLQAISGVLTTNNAVPIVSCFHFHLDEGKLTVKATDMATTLVTSISDIETNTAGLTDIAVPSKLLLDILKSLDDVPMTFSVDDKNFGIEIASGQGKYRLAGMNAENYPEMPMPKDTQKVVMPASVLATAISKTSFAASNDELRPQMGGIYCELTPDGATFVATDAQKLVRYRRNDIKADESTNFILPNKPMIMLRNIINGRKVIIAPRDTYNSDGVRNMAFLIHNECTNTVFIAAFTTPEGKACLTLMYTDDLVNAGADASANVREAARLIQGGGGGQKFLATAGGKNPGGLEAAEKALIELATK